MNERQVAELCGLLPAEAVTVQALLKDYTTFRIGGPADVLVQPANMEQVKITLSWCQRNQVPLTVLGNGSNVLVLDRGIRGVVVKFSKRYGLLKRQGTIITAGAGVLLKQLAMCACDAGLSGVEHLAGIPGSVGGAVYMNAGAYDHDTGEAIQAVRAVDRSGVIHEFSKADMKFDYRHSMVQDLEMTVAEADFCLVPGDKEQILAQIQDFNSRRRSKQPLHLPSAGSVFKRPPGYFAGQLIQQAGLKGFAVGGAQVSDMHAGFIVNTGQATAEDVLRLIGHVQSTVKRKFNVELETEVRILGE